MLLKLRRLLLEKAGFAVIDASSVEQALGMIAEGSFDLLVIGCDVVGETRELLLRQDWRVPTIVLYCGDAPDVAATAVCDCLDDPKFLVSTIQALLASARAVSSRRDTNNRFTRITLDRGIVVSVCTSCYRFITYSSHEDDLQESERAHVCADMQQDGGHRANPRLEGVAQIRTGRNVG